MYKMSGKGYLMTKITTEFEPSFEGGQLTIEEFQARSSILGDDIRVHICQHRINLFDDCVRDSLIKIGWTPPSK